MGIVSTGNTIDRSHLMGNIIDLSHPMGNKEATTKDHTITTISNETLEINNLTDKTDINNPIFVAIA